MKHKKISGFIAVLLGSFLLWFISKYKNDYEDTIDLEIIFENIPDSIALQSLNTSVLVNAKVRESGFSLLWNKMGTRVTSLDFKKYTYKRNDSIFFNPRLSLDNLQFDYPQLRILKVTDKEFFIPVYRYSKKSVTLKKDFKLFYEQNYKLIEDVGFAVDTVTIYGDQKVLKDIDFLRVESTEDVIVKDTFVQSTFKLVKPPNAISIFPEEVVYTVRAAQMTEGKISVPVEVLNTNEKEYIKVIPENVHVIFNAPVHKYNDVTGEDFKVYIDYNSISSSNETVIPKIKVFNNAIHDARLLEEVVQILIMK